MNDKYKSKSIVEALEKLRADIPDKLPCDVKEHNYMIKRSEMYEFLKGQSQTTQHIHSAWLPYMQEIIETRIIDAFFWGLVFKRLSEEHNVPPSWFAALRMKPVLDYTGSYLVVSKTVNPLDDKGFAFEVFYAAHLDGVESGMITDDTFLFQRQEEATMASDMASEMLEQIVELGGFESKEDFLSQFSHEYDMYLPSYENDDSP